MKRKVIKEDWTDSASMHSALTNAMKAYQSLSMSDKQAASHYSTAYNAVAIADAILGATDSINATEDEVQMASKLQQFASSISRLDSTLQSLYPNIVRFITGSRGSLPSQLAESLSDVELSPEIQDNDSDVDNLEKSADHKALEIPAHTSDDLKSLGDIIASLTSFVSTGILDQIDPDYAQEVTNFLNALKTILSLYYVSDGEYNGALDVLKKRLHDANMIMYGIDPTYADVKLHGEEPQIDTEVPEVDSDIVDDNDEDDPAEVVDPDQIDNKDITFNEEALYTKLPKPTVNEAYLEVPGEQKSAHNETLDTWLGTRLSYADRIPNKDAKKAYVNGMKYAFNLVKKSMPDVIYPTNNRKDKVKISTGDIKAFSVDNLTTSQLDTSVNLLSDLSNIKVVGTIPGLKDLSVVSGEDYLITKNYNGDRVPKGDPDVYAFLRSGKKVLAYFFIDPSISHPDVDDTEYEVNRDAVKDALNK